MFYFWPSVYKAFLENWKALWLFSLKQKNYGTLQMFFSEQGVIFFYYKTNIKGTKENQTKERKQFTSPAQKNQGVFCFKFSYSP